MSGRIVKVSGPLIVAEGMKDVELYDVVRVSEKRLIGEVIELRDDKASIEVYEETAGLGPGEPVESTGSPLSVELAPGLIESIFDGIQRPLESIFHKYGTNITRGISEPALDREKKWHFTPTVSSGDTVTAGDVIGTVAETELMLHKIMVPYGISGVVSEIAEGDYTVTDTVCRVATQNGTAALSLMCKWPVRRARTYAKKLAPDELMLSLIHI